MDFITRAIAYLQVHKHSTQIRYKRRVEIQNPQPQILKKGADLNLNYKKWYTSADINENDTYQSKKKIICFPRRF